ncbi:DNA mismatch repair endonuclease MutL [Huintestinicola sp.]|uniref:DNA mismatch repair endonuclease MutL n=1 Tax=Huintestinicola sp. TaxID=2981661 RepID=UPI003D7DC4BD
MPRVHVLDKELAELIAAGEVIERPSSVIKELVENSIDSGATAITVEIQQGGITYIRITDNGCGIAHEDVPVAFLRHATSKLNVKDDLSKILTLGFRGEALASICAVAKCEVITKTKDEEYGTHYIIEGTEEKLIERSGCPDGTTIIIRDIFYNVPARLKFLKQDKYEGNAIASIVSKISVSHPEISFRFIRNNKQELFTPGDNRLYSAVYSVFGKEFAASMLPVDYRLGGISVSGYTVKPLWGRKNRSMQHFFINGRYVKSLTCMSALEEAYRNCIMEGKFPACVIFMDVPPQTVDVNVHPAKTEVRFSDDKLIYDALYFAVKNAVLQDSKPAPLNLERKPKTEADYAAPMFKDPPKPVQTQLPETSKSKFTEKVIPVSCTDKDQSQRLSDIRSIKNGENYEHKIRVEEIPRDFENKSGKTAAEQMEMAVAAAEAAWAGAKNTEVHSAPEEIVKQPEKEIPPEPKPEPRDISQHLQSGYGKTADDEAIENLKAEPVKQEFKYIDNNAFKEHNEPPKPEEKEEPPKEIFFRIIGEAFKNYAIAEVEDGILIVDKHAAHERIRFENLRSGREHLTAQLLLVPEELVLDYGEYDALVKNLRVCADLGFDIEADKAPRVIIKGIPTVLDKRDAGETVSELAQNFAAHRHDPLPEILDDMYHTIACHGAIRSGDSTDPEELKYLVSQILSDDRIRYCPHGRPVMFKLTKKELEKQFRRIV